MRLAVLYYESVLRIPKRNGKETVQVVSRPPSNKDDRSARNSVCSSKPAEPQYKDQFGPSSQVVPANWDRRLCARDGGCANRFNQVVYQ